MSTFLIVFAILVVGMAGMAIGVIASGGDESKALRGSCGGPDINPDCCKACPEKDACGDDVLPPPPSHPLLKQLDALPESQRPRV